MKYQVWILVPFLSEAVEVIEATEVVEAVEVTEAAEVLWTEKQYLGLQS